MINNSIIHAEWVMISRELELVSKNIASIRPELMLACLRATYKWRARLPGWTLLVSVAKEHLAKKGLPSSRLLQGMI
jgi:hypothetical protein